MLRNPACMARHSQAHRSILVGCQSILYLVHPRIYVSGIISRPNIHLSSMDSMFRSPSWRATALSLATLTPLVYADICSTLAAGGVSIKYPLTLDYTNDLTKCSSAACGDLKPTCIANNVVNYEVGLANGTIVTANAKEHTTIDDEAIDQALQKCVPRFGQHCAEEF